MLPIFVAGHYVRTISPSLISKPDIGKESSTPHLRALSSGLYSFGVPEQLTKRALPCSELVRHNDCPFHGCQTLTNSSADQ